MVPTLEQVAYRVLPRVAPGRALADCEWRTLAAAAEVLLAGAPPGVGPERVADNVERFLVIGRSRRAFRVRVLLALLEYLPLAEFGGRFSRLTPAERRRIVEQRFLRGSKAWRLCARVRLLVVMGAYGDSRAEAFVGFVPVPLRARFRPAPPPRLREHANRVSAAP